MLARWCAYIYVTMSPCAFFPRSVVVEASYSGPSLEDEISVEFMQALLEWFKAQRRLHSKYAYKVGAG